MTTERVVKSNGDWLAEDAIPKSLERLRELYASDSFLVSSLHRVEKMVKELDRERHREAAA